MREELKEQVRRRYAAVALAVRGMGEDGGASCCGPSSCGGSGSGAMEVDLTGESYSGEERRELPRAALDASLGCGNPVALGALSPGEVVLDLASGGGIDVLLSAWRVSPGGKAYGLDMTDEMLDLARENGRKAGAENVEFLKGEIEDIPLPDEHVDVVISNCVINLSMDKAKVLAEAYRVLKPGGRLAVYDMVFLGDRSALPAGGVREAKMWTGCVSGALERSGYESLLAAVGFEDISVQVGQLYEPEILAGAVSVEDVEVLREASIVSAFVWAWKPVE